MSSHSISGRVIVLAVMMTLVWSCTDPAATPPRPVEARLRVRTALIWSHLLRGDVEAYVAMWSTRMRPTFRESGEDWQQHLRYLKLLPSLKPTFELIDVQITGLRARATMRVSMLEEPDGPRDDKVEYYYWVFENGDWFLDDIGSE